MEAILIVLVVGYFFTYYNLIFNLKEEIIEDIAKNQSKTFDSTKHYSDNDIENKEIHFKFAEKKVNIVGFIAFFILVFTIYFRIQLNDESDLEILSYFILKTVTYIFIAITIYALSIQRLIIQINYESIFKEVKRDREREIDFKLELEREEKKRNQEISDMKFREEEEVKRKKREEERIKENERRIAESNKYKKESEEAIKSFSSKLDKF